MREHIFKAQRLDTKEWIDGYYLFIEEQNKHYILSGKIANYQVDISHPHLMTKGFEWFEVDPETVCEDTGLLDKNGKKIFENDLLKDNKGQIGKVFYANGSFSVLWEMIGGDYETDNCLGYGEVIGNKFDNPELVEVSDVKD